MLFALPQLVTEGERNFRISSAYRLQADYFTCRFFIYQILAAPAARARTVNVAKIDEIGDEDESRYLGNCSGAKYL